MDKFNLEEFKKEYQKELNKLTLNIKANETLIIPEGLEESIEDAMKILESRELNDSHPLVKFIIPEKVIRRKFRNRLTKRRYKEWRDTVNFLCGISGIKLNSKQNISQEEKDFRIAFATRLFALHKQYGNPRIILYTTNKNKDSRYTVINNKIHLYNQIDGDRDSGSGVTEHEDILYMKNKYFIEYVAEISHAKQFNNGSEYITWEKLLKIGFGYITNDYSKFYHTEDNLEYDAHSIQEYKILNLLFTDEINKKRLKTLSNIERIEVSSRIILNKFLKNKNNIDEILEKYGHIFDDISINESAEMFSIWNGISRRNDSWKKDRAIFFESSYMHIPLNISVDELEQLRDILLQPILKKYIDYPINEDMNNINWLFGGIGMYLQSLKDKDIRKKSIKKFIDAYFGKNMNLEVSISVLTQLKQFNKDIFDQVIEEYYNKPKNVIHGKKILNTLLGNLSDRLSKKGIREKILFIKIPQLYNIGLINKGLFPDIRYFAKYYTEYNVKKNYEEANNSEHNINEYHLFVEKTNLFRDNITLKKLEQNLYISYKENKKEEEKKALKLIERIGKREQ